MNQQLRISTSKIKIKKAKMMKTQLLKVLQKIGLLIFKIRLKTIMHKMKIYFMEIKKAKAIGIYKMNKL